MVRPFRRGLFNRVGLNVGAAVPPAEVQPELSAQPGRPSCWRRELSPATGAGLSHASRPVLLELLAQRPRTCRRPSASRISRIRFR